MIFRRPTPSFPSIYHAASLSNDPETTSSDSESQRKSGDSEIDEQEIDRLLKKKKVRNARIKIENNQGLPLELNVQGIYPSLALNYKVSGITIGKDTDELDDTKPLAEVLKPKKKKKAKVGFWCGWGR